MSSQASIIETVIECSNKIKIPVWLSISCVFDQNKKVNLGYDDDINKNKAQVYENFEKSLKEFIKSHSGPILVAHSNMNVTGEAIKILKKNCNNIIGAYPNRGYFIKPEWKFCDKIKPGDYLDKAKSWIKDGAQIIGGCCGIGFEEIKEISILKN